MRVRAFLPFFRPAMLAAAALSAPFCLGQDVLWRFEIPSNYAGAFVGVGPDGRVYATDNLNLYALSPEGVLLWNLPGAGGGRPITFATDGTIYTAATGSGIAAVNPNGTFRWVFTPPTSSLYLAGPNVGPDGNLYAVQEIRAGSGIGAYSVSANGSFRWSNLGNPLIGPADLSNSDVVFGANRFFAGLEYIRGGFPITYSFSLDGEQLGQSGTGGWEIPATSFPRMLLDGRVVYRWGQVGLMVTGQDGSVSWMLSHPGGANYVVDPNVGPDGVIFSGNWSGIRLWAVNPNGTTRWVRPYESGYELYSVAPSPDNAIVVATGFPGFVRGYAIADGALRWHVDLAPEQGLSQLPWSVRPAFSPDGSVAYVTTRFVGNGVGHTYLYAISLREEITVAPTSYTVFPGYRSGGGLTDLFTSDDSYLQAHTPLLGGSAGDVVALTVEGTSPVDTPSAIRFDAETRVTSAGLIETVLLWDWEAGAYVQVFARPAPTSDSRVSVSAPGPVSRFVQSGTRQMKAKIGWKFGVFGFSGSWESWTDRTIWKIVP